MTNGADAKGAAVVAAPSRRPPPSLAVSCLRELSQFCAERPVASRRYFRSSGEAYGFRAISACPTGAHKLSLRVGAAYISSLRSGCSSGVSAYLADPPSIAGFSPSNGSTAPSPAPLGGGEPRRTLERTR